MLSPGLIAYWRSMLTGPKALDRFLEDHDERSKSLEEDSKHLVDYRKAQEENRYGFFRD